MVEVVKEGPPLYEEPTDEDLRKLLAPPDLSGFEAPVFPPAKPKKKKKKGSLGSKKKKKGKKKKKTGGKTPIEHPPAEPLFSYDPNVSLCFSSPNRMVFDKQTWFDSCHLHSYSMKIHKSRCC